MRPVAAHAGPLRRLSSRRQAPAAARRPLAGRLLVVYVKPSRHLFPLPLVSPQMDGPDVVAAAGNCEPRKKAALRQVKRDTPNRGRHFWTCPSSPRCGFFLWQSPEAAVADAAPTPKTPSLTQRPLTFFGLRIGRRRSDAQEDLAKRNLVDESPTPSRKRPAAEDDNDDFGLLSDPDDEAIWNALVGDKPAAGRPPDAEHQVDRQMPLPPAKDAPALPQSISRLLFTTPNPKRRKKVSFEEPPSPVSAMPTPAKTPPPLRSAARQPPLLASPPAPADDDLVGRVMGLLQDQPVPGPVLESVRRVLVAHVQRMAVLDRGRSLACAALAQREERMAQLQGQVAVGRKQAQLYSDQLTNIKAQLMKMYEDN